MNVEKFKRRKTIVSHADNEPCPKCGAPANCYHGDNGSFAQPPANKCAICGFRKELPMYSARMRVEIEKENGKYFKDCKTPGCEARINARSEYDHCKKCRGIMRAQQQLQAAQSKLDRLGVAA